MWKAETADNRIRGKRAVTLDSLYREKYNGL